MVAPPSSTDENQSMKDVEESQAPIDMATIDPALLQSMAQMLHLLGERSLAPVVTSSGKSEKTPDVDAFTPSSNSAANTQALDLFETRLETKFEVNADRYTTELSRINYVFSRLAGSAAETIRPSISKHAFKNWTDIIEKLRLTFGDQEPEWHYHQRFLNLRQANKPFNEFLIEFEFLASKTLVGNQQAFLTHVLRNALSRELLEKLQLVSLKDLDYDELVEECHKFAAVLRTPGPRHPRQPQPAVPPAFTRPPPATFTAPRPTFAAPPQPALPPGDPMDLSRRRRGPLTPGEKEERRALGLCLYCGASGHLVSSCPLAPPPRQGLPPPRRRLFAVETSVDNSPGPVSSSLSVSASESASTSGGVDLKE